MANMMGPPLLRPFNPNERRPNPDGSYSTEITTTWQLPDGQWANVPSLWMGPQGPVQFNPDDEDSIMTSMRNLEQINGPSFQRFPTSQAAEASAQERSMAGGAGAGKGVTLNINGRRVKVDDSFLSLTPEQQNATVDEIAQSLGGQPPAPAEQQSPELRAGLSKLSAITQNPRLHQEANKVEQITGTGTFADMTGSGMAKAVPFADEIASGLNAVPRAAREWWQGDGFDVGRAYDRNMQLEEELQRRRTERSPVASTVGAVAGGLGAGAPIAKGGLSFLNGAKPTLASMTGRGAAEGAAYGAAYGAGEGRGLKERAYNALWGAATGAAIGGVTGAAGRVGAKTVESAAPTADDVAAQAQALYRASEQQGVAFKQGAVKRLSDNLKLAAGRTNDRLRPITAGYMDDINAMASGDMSLEVFDEFRKSLNQSINKAMPDDARTLSSMKRMVDHFADNIGAGEMTGGAPGLEMLKSARMMWSRAKKAEVIERIMDVADVQTGQYTQSGLANTITKEMRALYKQIVKGKAAQAWTQEEIALIRQMAKGGSQSQLVNLLAKFAPRGVVSIVGGQAAGSILPGIGNVAVPLLGHVAGGAADKAAIQAAQTLRSGAALGSLPKLPQLAPVRKLAIGAAVRSGAQQLPGYKPQ